MKQQHGDHVIELTDDMRFKVSGPLYTEVYDGLFDSYQEAIAGLAKRLKQQEAQERTKLSILAVNDHGALVTITGVHARNYNALGVGDTRSLYPAEAWIIAAIKEQQALYERTKKLATVLRKYEISAKVYGGSVRSHEQGVQFFTNQMAEKTAAAKRDAPQPKGDSYDR